MKGKFQRTCLNKWRKMTKDCQWVLWPSVRKDCSAPRDVPKGHLVVYVGEEDYNYKRFVVKMTLLKHPLFKALLDRARDEYGFVSRDSKLCIPCDESLFLNVLRCAASRSDPKIALCFCF